MSRCAGLDALHSSTLHTAMHCRSFRDDDILKCLEQFCGLHDQRTCNKSSYGAECTVGMSELLFAVMSTFGFLLLSERGVIALSGFMSSARLQIFLHAFHLCERCLWLRSITGGAHSVCGFTFLPYETRGPALFDLRWLYGSFSLACEASCAPLPSAPPTGGVPGTVTTTTFLLTTKI